MDYKESIIILKELPEKYPLDNKEKEAVMTAIGLLSWGSLSKSRIGTQKAKRDKNTEW